MVVSSINLLKGELSHHCFQWIDSLRKNLDLILLSGALNDHQLVMHTLSSVFVDPLGEVAPSANAILLT